MSTVAAPIFGGYAYPPSESPLVRAVDRWIYVFMAAFFVTITLTGFVPDSIAKIAAVQAGERPPFPVALHFHGVLMGSFLVLLLAQTLLAATGRQAYHQRLGLVGAVLAPALVVAGLVLVPTMYQQAWGAMQAAPPDVQARIQQSLREFDNIMLMQIRIGVGFAAFILIALLARKSNPGLHKRMMFLAVSFALPAAFDRIGWLPTTLPESPLAPDLYILLAVSPMLAWDLLRGRTLHKAYVIWLGFLVPSSIVIHTLWDTQWWHATAPRLVGL